MTAIQPINQGPGSNAFPSNVRGIAAPLMILLLVRVGYTVLMRLLGLVGLSLYRFLPYQLLEWLPRIIGLAAVICYFIWGVRVINTLRARGEMTQYSPGFSVGAWFIPFANFVFPGLIGAEMWRRSTRSPAGPVALWWVSYMVFIVLDFILDLMARNFGGAPIVFTLLSWLVWAADLAAYGMWWVMVKRITEALENPPPAGGPGMGANPFPGSVQRS